jgi:hypothetical protein
VVASNADDLFQEAEKRVQSAQQAFNAKAVADTEPELPFKPDEVTQRPVNADGG